MADKGLNFLDGCAAKCIPQAVRKNECTSSSLGDSKIYTSDANWNK